jgi:predicted nucleotidyltransferase
MGTYKDDLSSLYNNLLEKGYSVQDIGTEDIFRQKMADKQNRKQLYDYVQARGDFRIGDFYNYERRIKEAINPQPVQETPQVYAPESEDFGWQGKPTAPFTPLAPTPRKPSTAVPQATPDVQPTTTRAVPQAAPDVAPREDTQTQQAHVQNSTDSVPNLTENVQNTPQNVQNQAAGVQNLRESVQPAERRGDVRQGAERGYLDRLLGVSKKEDYDPMNEAWGKVRTLVDELIQQGQNEARTRIQDETKSQGLLGELGRQKSLWGSAMVSRDVAKATDAKAVIDATKKYIDKNYTPKDEGGNGSGQLTGEQSDMRDALMQRVYDYLVRRKIPRSSAEYVMRKMFTGSTFGMLYNWMSGKSLEERQVEQQGLQRHTPTPLESIAGEAGSIVVDLPLMAATGGIGGAAGNAAMKAVTKPIVKRMMEKGVERSLAQGIATRAIQQTGMRYAIGAASEAANFAALEGIGSAAEQLYSEGSVDAAKLMKDTGRGALLGAAMGIFGTGNRTLTRQLENNIGEKAGKAVGYTSSLGGRTALMMGSSVLGQWSNNEDFDIENVDWLNEFTHAALTNIGFDVLGAVKKWGNTRGVPRKSFDPGQMDLTQEEIENLNRRGYKGKNAPQIVQSLMDMVAREGRTEDTEGNEENLRNIELKQMQDLFEDTNIDLKTKYKLVYLMTGNVYDLAKPTQTSDVQVNDQGQFTVETYNPAGQTYETRTFNTYDAANSYRKKSLDATQKEQVKTLEDLMDKANVMSSAVSLFESVGSRYGFTKEQMFEIYQRGLRGEYDNEKSGILADGGGEWRGGNQQASAYRLLRTLMGNDRMGSIRFSVNDAKMEVESRHGNNVGQIDELLKKPVSKLTEEEKEIVDDYVKTLQDRLSNYQSNEYGDRQKLIEGEVPEGKPEDQEGASPEDQEGASGPQGEGPQAEQNDEGAGGPATGRARGREIYSRGDNKEMVAQTMRARISAERLGKAGGYNSMQLRQLTAMSPEQRQPILDNMSPEVRRLAEDYIENEQARQGMYDALDEQYAQQEADNEKLIDRIMNGQEKVYIVDLGRKGDRQHSRGIVLSGLDTEGNPTQKGQQLIVVPLQNKGYTMDFSSYDESKAITLKMNDRTRPEAFYRFEFEGSLNSEANQARSDLEVLFPRRGEMVEFAPDDDPKSITQVIYKGWKDDNMVVQEVGRNNEFALPPEVFTDGQERAMRLRLQAEYAEKDAAYKQEVEAQRKAEEAARKQAEEEARKQAEAEAKRKAEEEKARQKAEEEARKQAEAEAKRQEEERKAREEAEARLREKEKKNPLLRLKRFPEGHPRAGTPDYEGSDPKDVVATFLTLGRENGSNVVMQNVQDARKKMEDQLKRVEDLRTQIENTQFDDDEHREQAEKFLSEQEAELDRLSQTHDFWNRIYGDVSKEPPGWRPSAPYRAAQKRYKDSPDTMEILNNREPMTDVELAAEMLASGAIRLLPEEFRNQTGFSKTEQRSLFPMVANKENGGVTLGRAGEMLAQESKERGLNLVDENDPMAGANAILEALQEAGTYGQMYRLIENHRIEQADRYYREEQRQVEEERENYYQEGYHMSYEDYMASTELDKDNVKLNEKYKKSDDYLDFMLNFVETKDNEDYGNNERRPDQTGVDGSYHDSEPENQRHGTGGNRETYPGSMGEHDSSGEGVDETSHPSRGRSGERILENGTSLSDGSGVQANHEGERPEIKHEGEVPASADADTRPVQGLESYTRDEISDIVRDHVTDILEENGMDAEPLEIFIHGSRNRGDARKDSDLDVVVSYKGKEREDDVFNLLHDEDNPLEIDGIKVDINPIRKEETGSMEDYIKKSKQYDAEIAAKKNEKETPADSGASAIAAANRAQAAPGTDVSGDKDTITSANNQENTHTEYATPSGRGVFGEVFDQFRGRAKDAFSFLANRKSGNLSGVLHRDKTGDIDLVWGDKSGGLQPIIEKYVGPGKSFETAEAAAETIDDVVKNGEVTSESEDKLVIQKDNKTVTLRGSYREDGKKTSHPNWILTGYEETARDNAASAETNPTVEAIHKAEEQVNPSPTDAQKKAGNYQKGHVTVDGYEMSIENKKGSTRSGVDSDGKAWSVTMNNTYGYIRGTKGVDGDHIDVFLSDDPTKGGVYVIDQVNPKTGEFDEHKVMYGFPSADAAREAYLANYSPGWKGLGEITRVDRDKFRRWIDSSKRKTKPFADYSIASLGNDKMSDYEDGELELFIRDYEEMIADGGIGQYPADDQAELADMINELERRDKEQGRTPYRQRRDEREKRLDESISRGAQAWTRYVKEGTVPPILRPILEKINPEALEKGARVLTARQLDDLGELLRKTSNSYDDDRWGATSQIQSGLFSGLADGVFKYLHGKSSVSTIDSKSEEYGNTREDPELLYPAKLEAKERNTFVKTFEQLFGKGKFETRKSDYGYTVETANHPFPSTLDSPAKDKFHQLYELMKDTGQATGRSETFGSVNYSGTPYVVYYDPETGIVYDAVITDGDRQGRRRRIILSRIKYDTAQPAETPEAEQPAEMPSAVQPAEQAAAARTGRRGEFFKKKPLTEAEQQAQRDEAQRKEVQERFDAEKAKFADQNPNTNVYAKALQESNTPEEAIQSLNNYIDKLQAEADDWLSRRYKDNKTVVQGVNKASAADTYKTSIGAANERRRANHVRSLQEEIDEAKSFIDNLKKKTGYKEPETAAPAKQEGPDIEAANEAKMKELEESLTQNESRQMELQDQLDNAMPGDEVDREALENELDTLRGEQMEMEAEYNGLRAMNEESEAIRRAEEEGQNIVSESSKPYLIRRKDELKAKYPNTLVLFHEGDYYFAYQDDADAFLNIPDAIMGDRILGGKKEKQAFFPAAKLDSCLPLLIKAGHRVAIDGEQDVKRASVSRSKAAKTKKNEGFTGDLFSQPDLQHVVPVKNEKPLKYTSFGGLDTSKGDYAYVERQFTQSGEFLFTGANQIKGADDVAYIFRELENKAIENVFVVMVKDGKPTVLHIGMGGVASSTADLSPLQAAANKIGGVDQVYMVHNHPSGNLVNSEADRILLSNIKGMFEDGVVQPGVIIDTTSGKYGIFDVKGEREERVRPTQGEDNALDVLRFDKQVFSPDYDLQGRAQITNSKDVAELVSAQRLGSCGKVNFLVMDHQSRVTANIHTTFSSIRDVEALAREIATAVPTFSGSKAVVYGDFPYDSSSAYYLSKAVERYSGKSLRLMDVIKVDGNYSTSKLYGSAADEGYINESDTQYGRNRVNDPEEEERQRIADKAKRDGIYLMAPNGKRSRLSERQWAEVRTKAFKDFFGDWESEDKNSSLVLDENGEPRVVYHGTKADFARFDEEKIGSNMDFGTAGKGFYFTTDRENAENYARNAEGNGKPRVVEAYLNIRNPKTGVKTMELDGSEKAATRFTEQARKKGYDGVEAESSYGVNRLHWFVAFDPKQVKIIPEEKPTDGGKSLVGVHNISEEKLRKALGLGGFANPSAAVVDLNKTGHDKYGEISLVMPSGLVDKKSGSNAGTWAGDAYTPRFPQTTKQFESGDTNRFYKDMKSLHLPDGMDERMYSTFTEYVEVGNSPNPLAYLFLHEKGRTPETVRKGLEYDEDLVNRLKKEGLLDKDVYRMSDKERQKLVDFYVDYHYGDWKKEIFKDGQTVFEAMQEADPNQFTEEGIGKNRLQDFWYDMFRSARDNGDVDYIKTTENAYETLKKEGLLDEFNQWLTDKENKYGVKEMLFNGYTPSGKKRYLPLTLENVSKMMKKEGRAGAESFFNDSPGAARARLSKNLNSLAAIRKAKDRLVSSSEMGGVIKEIKDKFFELTNLFMSDDEYDFRQNARLVDVLTSKDMRAAAKRYGVDLDDDQLKELKDFKELLQNAPTEYFETKFERPVMLNEFAAAVVPDDLPNDLHGRLKDAGLRIVQYKSGDTADRKRALEEASNGEGIRFSIRRDPAPKKTGIGYKVFVLGKDGKLYPPMVANPGGKDTPVGVWLNADAAPIVGESKTGRPKVKSGGKGTQGGSGKLAYRPGWHLGEIPYALQFNRRDPATGERALFPGNFVWAEVEYANDVDYQKEATSQGINENGKYQHSLAGLPRVPENGSYRYRTNPDPKTDEWIITGAMKVNRILRPSEVDEMVQRAGRKPQPRQEGSVTDEQVDRLNGQFQRYRFIGEKGAENLDAVEESTRRLDNLGMARQMEAKGSDVKAIKLATGWERGADGKWRYEQPDFTLKTDDLRAYMKPYLDKQKALRDKQTALTDDVNAKIDEVERMEKEHPDDKEALGKLNEELTNLVREAESARMDADEYDMTVSVRSYEGAPLEELIEDKALFEAYPMLRNIHVSSTQRKGVGEATFDSRAHGIEVGEGTKGEDLRNTLIHEVQHAIQTEEGFAKGGSPETEVPKYTPNPEELERMNQTIKENEAKLDNLWKKADGYEDKMRAIELRYERDEISEEEADRLKEPFAQKKDALRKQIEKLNSDLELQRRWRDGFEARDEETDYLGYERYQRLSGEVEARNTQSRKDMSDEQRRQTLASETEDVAREDQLFLDDVNKNSISDRFIGKKGASNLDKAREREELTQSLGMARQMETKGSDAKAIKLATGWERGGDGKWRYETMDAKSFDPRGNIHPERNRLSEKEQTEYEALDREAQALFDKGMEAYEASHEITEDTKMVDVWTALGMEPKKAKRLVELEGELRARQGRMKFLDDYIDDKELFDAYPELKKTIVEMGDSNEALMGHQGSYNPVTNTIKLYTPFKDTLVHEIQHAIQQQEGFTPGTSRGALRDARQKLGQIRGKVYEVLNNIGFHKWFEQLDPMQIKEAREKYRENKATDEFWLGYVFADTLNDDIAQSVKSMLDDANKVYKENERLLGGNFGKSIPEIYKSYGGEVEARNAASRVGLTEEQRRQTLASETEDVAREDQIFLENALGIHQNSVDLQAKDNLPAGSWDGRDALAEHFALMQSVLPGAQIPSIIENEWDIDQLIPKDLPNFPEWRRRALKNAYRDKRVSACYVSPLKKVFLFADRGNVRSGRNSAWHENFHYAFDAEFDGYYKDEDTFNAAIEEAKKVQPGIYDFVMGSYTKDQKEEVLVHTLENYVCDLLDSYRIDELKKGVDFGEGCEHLNKIANELIQYLLKGQDYGRRTDIDYSGNAPEGQRESQEGHRGGQDGEEPSTLRDGENPPVGREAQGGEPAEEGGIRYAIRKPRKREGESLENYMKRLARYNERLAADKASRKVENKTPDTDADEELGDLSMEVMQHPEPRRKEGESDEDFGARQAEYNTWVNERRPEIERRMAEIRQQLADKAANDRSEEMDEAEALYEGRRPSASAPAGTDPDRPDNVNNLTREEMREMREDFEERMGDMKIPTSKEQAARDIHQEIIERRRYIETGNLEDTFFVADLKKVAKTKEVLQAIPDYIEGTYTGEVTPELEQAAKMVSDWFEEVYNLMAQEGVLYDAPQIQNYVTHIWDWKRSPKEAQERYNSYVNTIRLRSPFTKHRVIPSYAEGKAMGMVPKYDDITGIITEYGHYATETIANHRMLEFLKGFRMFVPGGKDNMPMEVDIIVKDDTKDPIYSRMSHTALDGYKVLTEIKPLIAPVFGDQRILDHTQLSPLTNKLLSGIWTTSSLMKKVALSFSFFHHGALTETAIAMLKPWNAAKVIGKNLIWDTITKGEIPAMNDREATKDAVNHLVSLGATNDYSTADVKNFTTAIRQFTKDKNIPIAKQAAALLDWLNTGSDKLLWDVIHDGYKIASFKKMAAEIRRAAKRQKWTEEQLNDALDEAGQLVNDTFGGLHFDILGYSPKSVRIMRALLLSPDWTLATIRQALSPFGYGRLYKDNSRWQQLVKGTPAEQTRKKYGRQFWLTAGIFFYGLMNALNGHFRRQDEEEQKRIADEMRKTDPNYKSPYELAYPDGMKWYDYTMPGNTLGQQTHLFTGRYTDGTETYARWGKQFRELPELFFGRDGLSFPGPMIDKMAGKANPLMASTFEFISGHSLSGWENKDMKDKKGWEKDAARLYMLSKKFLPYSIPTQEDKDFLWLDLVMPSSKGFTPGKASSYFEKAIKSGDFNYVSAVYSACVMNNLNPEKFFNVAKTKIEAEAKAEQMEDIETVQDAMKAYDEATDLKQRRRLKRYIEQQTGAQDYTTISQAEMVEKAREVINGEDLKAKNDDNYIRQSTAEDILEDYRMQKTLAGLKRYHDTFREAQKNDPEAAQRMYDQQRMYIDGYLLTTRYRSALGRLKGTVGKQGADDRKTLEEIRRLRKEWSQQMEELSEKK